MNETWKKHPYISGLECSDWGRVKRNGKLIKLTVDSKKKYYFAKIDEKTKMVHRLIYETFKGIIEDGYEIDHINTNGFDNRPENLRTSTHISNCNNPQTISNHRLGRGYGDKLLLIIGDEQIIGLSLRDLQKKCGINRQTLCSHVNDTWYSRKYNQFVTLKTVS